MANYSIVVNSQFRPFSFERYLQPLQLYGQAYREQEDALAELSTQAATVEAMANEQTDPESYKAYQDYANALKKQADALATEGLTPSSRRAMLDMRKRYTQEVIPIQDAYNRRKEQAKMQADILAKDPTHIFGRMASTTSLDDYVRDKNLDLTLQNYSGALLTKQVSDEAAALAKAARNDPNVRTQLRHLLGFQYETIRQNGFSPEAVQEAILRSPNASPILTGIVDRVMAGSGIADWNYISPEEKKRVWNKAVATASQGLWSAVGQTQYGTVTDDAAKMAAEEAQAKRIARYKHSLENPEPTTEPRRGWNFLETNGDLAYYQDMQSRFTTERGGLKASYFGNKNKGNTFVNPMKVYEEALKAQDEARKTGTSLSERYKNRGQLSGTALYQSGKTGGYDDTARITAAREAIKNKYGVSEILSREDYNRLKELGYTSNSTFNDFRNDYSRRVDERASQWRHESVNLNETALKERGNTLSGYLQFMQDNDKLDGLVYAVNPNGTQGKAIKDLSDVGIKDFSKATLNDVFYSRQAPDKLHIQYGGVDMYVNPNAFGAEAASLIRQSNELLQMNDAQIKNAISRMYGLSPDTFTAEQARDFVAQDATAQLKDILRGYGKGRTTTDKNI